MTDTENTITEDVPPASPLVRMLMETGGDEEKIGNMIIAVLELLTYRAAEDTAYAIRSDDGNALFVVAVEDDAKALEAALPEHFKDYNDPLDEKPEQLELNLDGEDFLTNRDPGDEQPDNEPAA